MSALNVLLRCFKVRIPSVSRIIGGCSTRTSLFCWDFGYIPALQTVRWIALEGSLACCVWGCCRSLIMDYIDMFIHIVPHILAWWPEPCLVHFGPIFGGVVPWSENGHRHVDHRDTTYHHIFSPKKMFGGWYSIQYPLLYVILSTFRLFNVWHCILYIYTRIYIHTYIYILYWSHHGTSSCCGGCSFYLGKLTQIWITLKNPLFPGELKLYNWMKKYIICIIYIYWLMVLNIFYFSIYWE